MKVRHKISVGLLLLAAIVVACLSCRGHHFDAAGGDMGGHIMLYFDRTEYGWPFGFICEYDDPAAIMRQGPAETPQRFDFDPVGFAFNIVAWLIMTSVCLLPAGVGSFIEEWRNGSNN